MTFSHSIFRSVFFSVSASGISYLLIIFIARSYDQDSVAHYLYVVTWGLFLILAIDFAAEQSLVHYSRFRGCDIQGQWRKLAKYKILIFSSVFIATFLWEFYTHRNFPQQIALMVVPSLYMAPVYEFYKRNVSYAIILFTEKFTFLIIVLSLSAITSDINYIFLAYFFVTLAILGLQLRVIGSKITSNIEVQGQFDFINYMGTYLPVYLVLLSQLVYGNISRLIIDAKMGALAFASITLALQLVNSISMVQSQVDRYVRPMLIQAVLAQDRFALRAIVKNYLMRYLLPIVMLCIFISIFSLEIINVLFGEKWIEAGVALRFASPLIFTIACMRFIDIFVVALNAGKVNLVVNVLSATLLFGLLWFNPVDTLWSYVLMIVLCQGLHVSFMLAYLYSRANHTVGKQN